MVDEARLVKSEVLKTVVEPMKNTPRENAVKIHQKYPEAPLEEGRIIYISSAWLKTCDLYQRFLDFYSKMTTGSKDYFVASLDWRVGVDAGLFTEASIIRAKEDPEMTSDKFIYEYEGVFVGSSNESYYPYELTSKCRVLDTCELKQPKNCKYNYIITHDVAVSTKKNSDNACTHVIKLIPKVNGTFDKQLVYTITLNGASLAKQRDLLRELIHLRFPNTVKLVIDAQSAGQGLLSLLEEPWSVRDEKGEQVEYPPLVCDDDEEAIIMLPEAIPIIRGIKATVEFNIDYYPYMRSCFEDRSLKLLVNSSEKDEDYKDEKNPYTAEEYLVHVEHDILVEELNNIKRGFTENGRLVYDRIIKTNKRDRATSLMYGLSVVSEMEKEGKAHAYAKEDENELDYLVKYIF